uniref:Sister chromatid cohesion protein DCC1 n=1 Tax=Myxobolus squamalis TaxID=59785 RepID=A0A6B2GAQ3_MYXSQ
MTFFATWNNLLPLEIRCNSDYLQGIAVENVESKTITYFPKSALSYDTVKRMNEIFDFKEKWSKKEIEPYLFDILETEITLDYLLLNYCIKKTDGSDNFFYIRKSNFMNFQA